MTRKSLLKIVALSLLMSACANLHHIQVGTIDNRFAGKTEEHIPFEVMVSETGVSTKDIETLGKIAGGDLGDSSSTAAEALGYFQMGPKTGNPIYKYPVISGEIVKVRGVCRVAKKS